MMRNSVAGDFVSRVYLQCVALPASSYWRMKQENCF